MKIGSNTKIIIVVTQLLLKNIATVLCNLYLDYIEGNFKITIVLLLYLFASVIPSLHHVA
jgi:hypothetical protein